MRDRAKETGQYFWFSLAVMLISNRLVYAGGRFFSQGRLHHNLTIPADSLIPVLPWTISIYFGCFVFWVLLYYRIAQLSRQDSDRFFSAALLAKGICFLLFVLFPTTMDRPEPFGAPAWEGLMRFLYRIDAPDNLFPSIHCLISWLCWVGVRGNARVSIPWRAAAFLMAVIVCLSTLTIRQHVLLDAAGSILLSEFCYCCAGTDRLRRGYSSFVDGFFRGIAKAAGHSDDT